MSRAKTARKLNASAVDVAMSAVADELERSTADYTPKDWFSRLPSETQIELTLVRDRYREGKLSHLPLAQIWRHCKKRLALSVGVETFSTWLRKEA